MKNTYETQFSLKCLSLLAKFISIFHDIKSIYFRNEDCNGKIEIKR